MKKRIIDGNPTLVRQKINSIAQHFRLPVVCVLCQQYHRGDYPVCRACESLLTPIQHPCIYCSIPLIDAAFPTCGACIKKRPFFDKVFSAYLFEGPLRNLLHQFKYQQALYLRPFLVKLMMDALACPGYQPDCLIPVPLHSKRLKERGFNQAAELTKGLAGMLRRPYELTLCKKIINTLPQVGLSSKERRSNLRRSFVVQPSRHRHIALIDDLLTTGSTANEIAKRLKQQGVERVDIWCCARTGL